ncbi:hypothetical protein WJX72_005936 [[Myrmecia] bisecta]|uniref:AAA+ ATPase domain-containing protein n=1 Tax=[Myrmecia] bisecta TaxID=41462 RepID=A0AAW1P4T0_9CHLO
MRDLHTENNITERDSQLPSGDEEGRSQQDLPWWRQLVFRLLGTLSAVFASLKPKGWPEQSQIRRALGLGLMFGVALAMLGGLRVGGSSGSYASNYHNQEVVYSQFLDHVRGGHVGSVRIDEGSQRVYFNMRVATSEPVAEASTSGRSDAEAAQPASQMRVFYAKKVSDPTLIPVLVAAGVEFGAVKASMLGALARMFWTVVAVWLPLMPLFWIMRRALNSRTGAGRKKGASKNKTPVITFRDVAGVDSAKEELLEVVACLRDSQRYAKLNAKMPSGVLLTGPPGTGKTLLAKAVAGEAGVPFFAASASEFVELFVGRGAARIRDLFAEARKRAPCVVFIDELDAVGGKRGIGMNEERDQTLNQLLTELDGFEGRSGVLLLAATNRPEVLDTALTRPGRLSRRVVVPLPDENGRSEILAVHLRTIPMASQVDKELACSQITRISNGFSGAELANVVNEAALLAGRKGADVVGMRELVEAVQRTRYGVNGGRSALQATRGITRRLNDWLLDSMSTSKQMRTTPMGTS